MEENVGLLLAFLQGSKSNFMSAIEMWLCGVKAKADIPEETKKFFRSNAEGFYDLMRNQPEEQQPGQYQIIIYTTTMVDHMQALVKDYRK